MIIYEGEPVDWYKKLSQYIQYSEEGWQVKTYEDPDLTIVSSVRVFHWRIHVKAWELVFYGNSKEELEEGLRTGRYIKNKGEE